MLLDRGCEPDVPKADGATPLFMACQGNHYEVVKLLVGMLSSMANAPRVTLRAARGVCCVR
jgi:ankyrin repeat protein